MPDENLGPSIDAAPTIERPLHHPVIRALENRADPGSAFLRLLWAQLDPGAWGHHRESGFWWTPYSLRHEYDILRSSEPPQRALVSYHCVLVQGVTDLGQALETVNYLNERPFGCSFWIDLDRGSIHATASADLDPAAWWNAVTFSMLASRFSGVLERLAPRLAEMASGQVAEVEHPEMGRRTEPDQLVDEYGFDTFAPEAATGLWFAPSELQMFRRTVRFLLNRSGLVEQSRAMNPEDYSRQLSASDNFHLSFSLPTSLGAATLSARISDHPDFGRGVESLLTLPVLVDAPADVPGAVQSSLNSKLIANAMNLFESEAFPSGLSISGWCAARSQLCRSTYVSGEISRTLQTLAGRHVGEMLGLMLCSEVPFQSMSRLEADDWCGFPVSVSEDVYWGGVEENSGFHSLLVDDQAVIEPLLGLMPLNEISGPLDLDLEVWSLQHTKLVVAFGIFNPAGPSVGSLETAINHVTGRAFLFERLRHPLSPRLRLHAVMDEEHYRDLKHYVRRVIASLDWSPPDWVDIRSEVPEVAGAVLDGLRDYARESCQSFRGRGRALLSSIVNPWERLVLESAPEFGKSLGDPGDADTEGPIDAWVDAVTRSSVVDSHTAYLRSAWEASKVFAGGDVDGAQSLADRLSTEVDIRRRGAE
jgi:hypothetical protein